MQSNTIKQFCLPQNMKNNVKINHNLFSYNANQTHYFTFFFKLNISTTFTGDKIKNKKKRLKLVQRPVNTSTKNPSPMK